MNASANYIIAIDPDTVKSGVAIYDPKARTIELGCMSFWDLLPHIQLHYNKDN